MQAQEKSVIGHLQTCELATTSGSDSCLLILITAPHILKANSKIIFFFLVNTMSITYGDNVCTLTSDECARIKAIEEMAEAPKGKPTDEQKAKMDDQKKLRVEYCSYLRQKYQLDVSIGDKKLVKDILAAAALLEEEGKKQDLISLVPPSGTRDFYPDDMRLQSWLFEQFHAVAREFGFQVTHISLS